MAIFVYLKHPARPTVSLRKLPWVPLPTLSQIEQGLRIVFPMARSRRVDLLLQEWDGDYHMKISLRWDYWSDCQQDTEFDGSLLSMCIHYLHLYDSKFQFQFNISVGELFSECIQITSKPSTTSPLLLLSDLSSDIILSPEESPTFLILFPACPFSDHRYAFQVVYYFHSSSLMSPLSQPWIGVSCAARLIRSRYVFCWFIPPNLWIANRDT